MRQHLHLEDVLVSDQGVLRYTKAFKDKLDRFCRFLVLVFVPYWFKVSLSSDAAVVDLNMYHLLLKFSSIDRDISQAVLTTQSRHLWYLCPDSIILWCLFGSALTKDEKSRIAAVLLTKPKPDNFEAKKVKFPILTPATKLEDLISPISWFPFHLLGLKESWLKLPQAQWKEDRDYLEMKDFARSVKLTNDVAERGVKLIDDFANILTTDSEERKKLVLAVQNHRKKYKHLDKVDLIKRIDDNQNQIDENKNVEIPEDWDDFENWSDDQNEDEDE